MVPGTIATSIASSTATPSTSAASTPAQPQAPVPASYARAIGHSSPRRLGRRCRFSRAPRIVPTVRGRHPTPAPIPASTPKPTTWNPGRRGLDPPIQVSQTALDSIKRRKDSNKLCNNHYLRGPCAKGDSCCFEHKYKPTKDEINAIAFLTRLNPCANGQDCDVEDCIYGHHVSFHHHCASETLPMQQGRLIPYWNPCCACSI